MMSVSGKMALKPRSIGMIDDIYTTSTLREMAGADDGADDDESREQHVTIEVWDPK